MTAKAILSEERLPVLELGAYGASSTAQSASGSLSSHAQRQQRPSRERRTTLATYLRSDRRSSSMLLSSEARPFKFTASTDSSTTNTNSEPNINEHWTPSKIKLGVSIYPKVAAIQPFHAEKITGMLLEGLPTPQLQRIINIDEDLRVKVEEAMNILTSHSSRDAQQTDSLTTTTTATNERLLTNKNSLFDKQPNEYAPLFWQ
ncbi:unnamed protein product, partial [Rotaria magnacalcarata]